MIKLLNNGKLTREIRCVDSTGVERRISEIRKGDSKWWMGEYDPPAGVEWEKIAEGMYQTKAFLISSSSSEIVHSDSNPTNYVVSTFNAYENTLDIEFFGDFENVPFEHDPKDLSGNVSIGFSYTDNTGYTQRYVFSCNVFPKNAWYTDFPPVREQEFTISGEVPSFTEDESFTNQYGHGWVVQGVAGHNAMLSNAYGYDDNVTNWGSDRQCGIEWYNKYNGASDDYVCSINGRALHVATSGSTATVVFCPPGGQESGWVSSTDSWFPSASGWLQLTKKDGYKKFFNVNTGRFAEFLDKSKIAGNVLTFARASISTKMSDEFYNKSVVCTLITEKHISDMIQSSPDNLSSEMEYDDSEYSGEVYFDLFSIPFVDLASRTYMYGHYNPSIPAITVTDNGDDTMSYTVKDYHILYDSKITFNYVNGSISSSLVIREWLKTNGFLTRTFPAENYVYGFAQPNDDYVSLIIACVKNYGSDVVGNYHEYRLPSGYVWALASNSSTGYVEGTGEYDSFDGSFTLKIRPSQTYSTYYHLFSSTHKDSTTTNRRMEIWANRTFYYKTPYTYPQSTVAEADRVIPLYWHKAKGWIDALDLSVDSSLYLVSNSNGSFYDVTVKIDWDPDNTVYKEKSGVKRYHISLKESYVRVTAAKYRFEAHQFVKYLPVVGDTLTDGGSNYYFSFYDDVPPTDKVFYTSGSGKMTIEFDRINGVYTCTSTAKNNLPGYTENPERYKFSLITNGYFRKLYAEDLSTNTLYEIDMVTGEFFDANE